MSFNDIQNNVIYNENANYKVTAYGDVVFGDDESDRHSLSDGLIEMGVDGRPSEPVLVLSSRGGNKIGAIQNVRSINITHPLSDVAELSFDVYKEIDGVTYKDWDKIKDFKFIQMPHDNNWFEAKVTLDEENEIIKHVTCVHANEAELGQLNLYEVEINTDADIERDDYEETFFYNEDNPKASLLHRVLSDKAPHYQIYHVDDTLKGLWRQFSFNGTSIQDALNQIAEEVGCLFVYGEWSENDGKYHRTISAYDLEDYCYHCGKRGNYSEHVCTNCGSTNINYGYGEDTGIFISRENLATSINYESNTDNVKNCFRLVAGDDVMTAAVKSCNPSMSQYIWYFSDDMLEDMSTELRNKIVAYQNLVSDYQTTQSMNVGAFYVNNYNSLVSKYSDYNDELVTIDYPIIGTAKLTEAYYNGVNLYGFIKSELMPASEKVDSTTAFEQLDILQTGTNMTEVGISSVKGTIPYTTANSAIQSYAKVYIDTSRYKVTVSTYSIVGTVWNGEITIQSYTDEEDSATADFEIVLFDSTNNQKYAKWLNQSVQKTMANREVTDLSVVKLFNTDETLQAFKTRIQGYSLDYLSIMDSMATSAITILTEQGIANGSSVNTDIYTQLYKPYLDKSRAIQAEIAIKEKELSYLQRPTDDEGNTNPRYPEFGLLDIIVNAQNDLSKLLDMQTYLGDELWTELSFYRREDEYQNSNYISDGFTDSEIIEQAQRFVESANKEIIKASTLQHTISAPLIDFLIMPEFIKLQKKFKTGNWIRLKVDESVYKLRLTNWTVDFDNIEDLDVEFSDVIRVGGSVSDIASILSKSRSMATTYDYTAKQANKGRDANEAIRIYRDYGIDFRKIKAITSKGNTNIVYDDDGILLKRVDGTETLPEQARIYNNGIYITKDAWETVSTGLGHYSYVDPETGETIQTYGIIADTVIGKLILGENLKIYSESGKFEMGDDGLKITAIDGENNADLFVVQKESTDGSGQKYVEKYIYVDSNGEVKISGNSITLSGKPLVDYISDAIDDADIDVSLPVSVQLDSSTGVVFNSDSISTVLTATVYRGGTDITSQISEFVWTKKDKNGNIDSSWTRTTSTNTLNLSINNINEKVIIGCEVDVPQEGVTTTSYGSITISKIHDGSQFWTSTEAPISPDYTFAVSDLVGDTNADIKDGDIIYYSHYRYTVTSVSANGTTVLCGNRESIRGADGISPTVKSIVCSHSAAVCEKDGSYNPSSITFNGQAQTQDTITSYEGWFVIELSSDAQTWVSSYSSVSKESFVNYSIPLGVNITKDGIIYYQGSTTTVNGSVVDSNFTISSDGIITTTQDIGFIIRSIRCSLYSDSNKTELIDQQRVNIAFDGVDGDNGDDGYTVVLSNENHTFAGNTTSAIDGGIADCDVIGLKGGMPIQCHIGTISGCPTGMTATVLVNDSNNAKFRVAVTSEMTSQNGVLNVPVIVDEKLFNMKFTYSLKLNGLDATGLGWMVNYSAPTVPNNGECIYYGFDEVTKEPSFNTDGWVLWNGQEVTIPHGCYVNPDDTMPYNTTIYSVYRLPTSTTYTGGTFHDVAWVSSTNTWKSNTYNGTTATADVGTWTWDEDRDIILAMYVEPSNDGTITNAQLFTPPKKFSELVEPAKEMAKEAEKVAYHYLKVDATGAMVANMTDDNNNEYTPSNIPTGRRNILITANDLRIRDGQNVLATYGDTITLGKSNGKNVVINSSGITLNDGSSALASYGDSVVIGRTTNPHIVLDSNSFNAYSANNKSYFSLGDGSTSSTESYAVPDNLASFTTTYPINTITSVKVGSTTISSGRYRFSSGDNKLLLLDIPTKNSTVSVTYTYSSDDETASSNTQSFTVGAISLTIPLTVSNISIVSVIVRSGTTSENVTSDCDYNSSSNSIVFTNDTYVPPADSIVDVNYTINNTSPYFTFGTRNSSYVKGNGSASFASSGVASGANSFTTGVSNKSTGTASFTTGTGNTASGIYSFAEGRNNTASGSYAHAEGYGNTVNNIYGHAEGYGNTVSGTFSHAEGRNNKSSGTYSHSEGYTNTASGAYSHAGGTNSIASGITSFAHGEGLQASMKNAAAFGRYNEPLGFLFTVGNGTSSSARANAFAVGQGGNCYIGKKLISGTLSNNRKMFRTKEWSWDNLSIAANSTLGTHTSSIAIDYYTPIAISFIQLMNATTDGANSPNCNCYVCRFAETNRSMLSFNIKNLGDSAAKIRVRVEILYMATTALG